MNKKMNSNYLHVKLPKVLFYILYLNILFTKIILYIIYIFFLFSGVKEKVVPNYNLRIILPMQVTQKKTINYHNTLKLKTIIQTNNIQYN